MKLTITIELSNPNEETLSEALVNVTERLLKYRDGAWTPQQNGRLSVTDIDPTEPNPRAFTSKIIWETKD